MYRHEYDARPAEAVTLDLAACVRAWNEEGKATCPTSALIVSSVQALRAGANHIKIGTRLGEEYMALRGRVLAFAPEVYFFHSSQLQLIESLMDDLLVYDGVLGRSLLSMLQKVADRGDVVVQMLLARRRRWEQARR